MKEQSLIFRTFDIDKDVLEVQKSLWRDPSLNFLVTFQNGTII